MISSKPEFLQTRAYNYTFPFKLCMGHFFRKGLGLWLESNLMVNFYPVHLTTLHQNGHFIFFSLFLQHTIYRHPPSILHRALLLCLLFRMCLSKITDAHCRIDLRRIGIILLQLNVRIRLLLYLLLYLLWQSDLYLQNDHHDLNLQVL